MIKLAGGETGRILGRGLVALSGVVAGLLWTESCAATVCFQGISLAPAVSAPNGAYLPEVASLDRAMFPRPDDIALVESATVGWQRAVDALRLDPGDRILASASSYVSSALHLLELRRSRGIEVEVPATVGVYRDRPSAQPARRGDRAGQAGV